MSTIPFVPKFVMLNPPATVYFDGTREDMRGSINVTNMYMTQFIVFMVDSSPNHTGDRVIRCLPRAGIVRPSSFKTVELFTEILNEEKFHEFQRNNHTVSVEWRPLPGPPAPIESAHSLYHSNTSPTVTETVRCVVRELPRAEEVEVEYTEDELSLLGEQSTNPFDSNTRPSM